MKPGHGFASDVMLSTMIQSIPRWFGSGAAVRAKKPQAPAVKREAQADWTPNRNQTGMPRLDQIK
jgi:hypothetical protein